MASKDTAPKLRFLMLAAGGVTALGLLLSGVVFADGLRRDFSDADRAESEAAVARMDAAQARADEARARSQKHVYKGY
ncbi:hypothetical protein [Brevundimonas sp.]|uniref:hypothetical protein n=1 Tax=Brevundimonas sp. TaxID=1871086 RepID=UPI002D54947E|nr:hypothetical protein [Brevundimonas sp.]HYC75050.1 hypothetical protein [Brevundimonas sp.]